jgi:isopentenyl-diphosphate delta-isomerase
VTVVSEGPSGSVPGEGREEVLLVAEDGTVLGRSSKLAAHEPPGRLHLAFSVFLFTEDGGTVLQRRAATKYHFPGVWANACCSHPQPGEDLTASAERRVREELGAEVALSDVGSFVYRATCPMSGLVEYELDHVLVGVVARPLSPDPREVDELRVAPAAEHEALRHAGPEEGFAPWFAPAFALALAGRGEASERGERLLRSP